MSVIERAINVAPFVELIELGRISAEDLLRTPADRIALVEHITPRQVDDLATLLREARELTATNYRGERPSAMLIPIVYVLADPGEIDGRTHDAIAATGAVPIRPEEWEEEQAALKPLLTDPLQF